MNARLSMSKDMISITEDIEQWLLMDEKVNRKPKIRCEILMVTLYFCCCFGCMGEGEAIFNFC